MRRESSTLTPAPYIWLTVACLATAGTWGCDDDPPPVPPPDKQAAATAARPDTGVGDESVELEGWLLPQATDLAAPSEKLERRHLELTEPERFGPCHEILERGDAPKQRLGHTGAALETRLFGCDIADVERTDDRLYLAYPVPDTEHEATDLRLAVYGATLEDGAHVLQWSHRMDRGHHSKHFEARLRQSFISVLPPNVACTGTLWSGATQIDCLSYDGSKVEWSDTMDFWSSIPLEPAKEGLVGVDVSGLTRRYPYSGVEMARQDLPGRGGHSALYAIVDDMLVYAPEPPMSDDEYKLVLSGWSLTDFEPEWRRKLPARLDPTVNYLTFEPYVFVKIRKNLVAVDTRRGEPVWSVRVGSDRPRAVRDGDTLYLLIRRYKAPNLLYALTLETGDVQWFARTPTGSLDVAMLGDDVALKSIRAVQVVKSVGSVPKSGDATAPPPE